MIETTATGVLLLIVFGLIALLIHLYILSSFRAYRNQDQVTKIICTLSLTVIVLLAANLLGSWAGPILAMKG